MNNDQFEQNPHSFKRPRNFDDDLSNSSNSLAYQSMNFNVMNTRIQPPNGPVNPKGIGNIFFKTRFCAKFKQGMCRNGEGCNFAHGNEDLRQPPPNWQEIVGGVTGGRAEDRAPPLGNWDDDQKIIQRLKLCKKFYKGEECPYGEKCNFIHEDPARLPDDSGRFRESSAINIGTTGELTMINGSSSNLSEASRCGNICSDPFRKTAYWKTRLCTKWETTCQCPFGEKCHFAHGLAELQSPGVSEVETGNAGPSVSGGMAAGAINEQGRANKWLLNCNGSKKINSIYGDWIDDVPSAYSLSNQLET